MRSITWIDVLESGVGWFMSAGESVDAASGVEPIVSRIVKKANAVRGSPRLRQGHAPALVLSAKRRIM
ncbi:TPA: hypothetical protein ACXND4_005141, partial [Burkholderia multivorans]